MQVNLVQHAVGQGGFFSGQVSKDGKPLRWVYDCGSNQYDDLKREVGKVAEAGDIDMLFLSHLDSDHVCGVDLLLTHVSVREVVLPYLNDRILLATMARDAFSGALTGTFVEASSNLATWFGSRGVETITFIGGPDEDGDGGGPNLPFDPNKRSEGDCQPKWTLAPQRVTQIIDDSDFNKNWSDQSATMQRVPSGAAVQLTTPMGALNWALIPYVHLPSAMQQSAFEQALKNAYGKPLNTKSIISSAKSAIGREKLRDCYDALWLDHNLVTMTLYCGPLVLQHARMSLSNAHYDEYEEAGGWMLTGDAHLNGARRRQRFLSFYQRVTPMTRVLMLPHHGSICNHSDLVLDAMPKLIIGYAAAGPNSYGHPHDGVKDAVTSHQNAEFRVVSQLLASQLVMDISMS